MVNQNINLYVKLHHQRFLVVEIHLTRVSSAAPDCNTLFARLTPSLIDPTFPYA